MIYLLDTNILIYLSKNRPPQVAQRIDALGDDDSIAMSFITWAELLRGVEGSATADYYRCIAETLPPEIGFEGRNRRPPHRHTAPGVVSDHLCRWHVERDVQFRIRSAGWGQLSRGRLDQPGRMVATSDERYGHGHN